MRRGTLIWLSAVGFATSLLVHATTFVYPAWVSEHPQVYALHVLFFIAFIPGVLALKGHPKADRWPKDLSLAALMGVCMVYAMINFVSMMSHLKEGSPRERNGSYELHDHGRFVRTLTKDEFDQYRAYEARGFSGHWMLFYAASVCMHIQVRRLRIKDEQAMSGGIAR
jgi:hypothetical protein